MSNRNQSTEYIYATGNRFSEDLLEIDLDTGASISAAVKLFSHYIPLYLKVDKIVREANISFAQMRDIKATIITLLAAMSDTDLDEFIASFATPSDGDPQ